MIRFIRIIKINITPKKKACPSTSTIQSLQYLTPLSCPTCSIVVITFLLGDRWAGDVAWAAGRLDDHKIIKQVESLGKQLCHNIQFFRRRNNFNISNFICQLIPDKRNLNHKQELIFIGLKRSLNTEKTPPHPTRPKPHHWKTFIS